MNNYDHPMLSIALRNLQILKESNQLIETTKEIRILETRKNDVLEMLDVFERYEIDYPKEKFLLIGGAIEMRIKFFERYNQMVYRVAKVVLENFIQKNKELLHENAKEKNAIEAFEKIDKLREIVILYANNKDECFNSLNEIHYKIEDAFSNQTKPMETKIKIRIQDYDLPKYRKFMPQEIYDAIELADLKSAIEGKEVLAEVSKELFDKMIADYNQSNRKQ